jgi:protein tyrosine kinase modulator
VAEETQELKQTVEQVWAVAGRRRWWILSTFCCVTLATILVSFLIPAKYKSEATILVEQQQVPERYVTPTSTSDLLQALQAMTQDILSRTRLLQIISEFELYPAEKKRMGPDELVQMMRKNIEIEPLVPNPGSRSANAFKISYVGSSPAISREVVSRLTSLFIVENLKTREEQAKGTTTFLEDQLATAHAALQQQEQRLRDFKMEHLGELPQEQQGNLQILSGLQMQLQNTMAALGRAHEQQVYLESLLAQYRNLSPKTSADPNAAGPARIAAVERELTALRTKRAELVAHYTPEHPDVVNINRQIAQTEALLETLRKNQKSAPEESATSAASLQISPDDDPAVAQIKSQLKANQVEIANDTAAEKQLQARIVEYQHRLNETPVREQELSDMLRDYTMAQQNYADLESKKTQSALATSLVQNQQGEQFRIVDPASLPTRPYSPDRRKLGLLGAGLGLALGVGLALGLEMKDTSFRSEKEVSQILPLPFVLGVPVFLTAAEESRRSRTRILEWISGSFLVTAVLMVEAIVLWRG